MAATLSMLLLSPVLIGLPLLGLYVRTVRRSGPMGPWTRALLVGHSAWVALLFIMTSLLAATLDNGVVTGFVWMSAPFLWASALALLVMLADYDLCEPGHCPCGYNLAGNRSGTCPECGQRIAPEPPSSELA